MKIYASDAMADDAMKMQGFPPIEEIHSGQIRMYPFFKSPIKNRDYRYVTSLCKRYKYNTQNDEQIVKQIEEQVKYLWEVWLEDVRVGVIFFRYMPEVNSFTFDAYRDDQLMKCLFNNPMHTFRAGKMALDWFEEKKIADKVFTIHDVRSRAATIMCRRLGFKKDLIKHTDWGDFIAMRKDFENKS